MKLIILCGPPGSGKTTLCKEQYKDYVRISQDDFGKEHLKLFTKALDEKKNIIVDRMGFNKQQRMRYIEPAKNLNYEIKIVVLHQSSKTCMERMMKRENHPTINGLKLTYFTPEGEDDYYMSVVHLEEKEKSAKAALHTFFKGYERPLESEADEIEFRYPEGYKPEAVICDLDGTLCDTKHRQHHVQITNGKKDWRNFFAEMDKDPVNDWCKELIVAMKHCGNKIIYCSGRGEEYRERTETWLKKNNLWDLCAKDLTTGGWNCVGYPINHKLFMRQAGDSRVDWQIKENILDFEILTEFTVLFAVDDRQQVIDMWRRRGIVALQCAKGDF